MSFLGLEELKDYVMVLKQLFAEFLGTFLYLSITLLAGLTSNNSVSFHSLVVVTALSNGFLVASIIQVTGHISGGHINPAVTVGVLASGRMKIAKGILYIGAQILGSLLGAFVAYGISEITTRGNLGATIPYNGLRVDQVLGLEFLMTFILVSVVLSVNDTNKPVAGLGSGALAIGISIVACQSSALFYSASLNPVRSLGPAVMMNIWTHHWVFWIGPLLGGLCAGLIYRFMLVYHSDML
ncbi:aquaporin-like [Danaus plexippus]|uniref:aquaporin-like n=1 Tax=Danaus plexippus TaxID=13037 RepID=UPI002AAFF9FD|nr:aquaporin-like [Danaus plexippus]